MTEYDARFQEVCNLAKQVWGSPGEYETKFNNWLLESNRALGGEIPIELMSDGRFDEVETVLYRILYGDYS